MSRPECLLGVKAVVEWRRRFDPALRLGFVPTLGALHEGHLSLIRAARAENDRVIVSVYVNPMQFGPGEDLEAYPRDLERDMGQAGEAGGDVVVTFSDRDMVPLRFSTAVDVGGVSEGLCGASRPGHFRGVTTVVTKLFNLVRPHRAYFGQKDAQQSAVIRRMTEDLNFDVEIRVMPTVREEDGLAMSSRNATLSPEERKRAVCLFRALGHAKSLVESGEKDATVLREAMASVVEKEGEGTARIDYIEVVDPDTFEVLDRISGPALGALAVHVGPARLIDNMLLTRVD